MRRRLRDSRSVVSRQSPMQGVQNGVGVALGDPQQCPRCTFGLTVALLPILKGAETDPDEGGELCLGESELVAHGCRVGPVQFVLPACSGFATEDGAAFLEAGDQFFEEFIFHGNSRSINDLSDSRSLVCRLKMEVSRNRRRTSCGYVNDGLL